MLFWRDTHFSPHAGTFPTRRRLPPSLSCSPESNLKKCSNNSQIALKTLRLMSLSVVRCHCLWGSTARMGAFSTSPAIEGVPLV
jgi:hypothetical protein